MALRRTRLYHFAQKPMTVMGGDRELVMFTGLLAFALAFAAVTWLATGFALLLWTVGLMVLRKLAKADPFMRWVYLRQISYRRYYPPRASPWRINSTGQAARYR
jgi:type IV secretion system protein VirB3